MATPIGELLGAEADSLLKHVCKTIPKQSLHLPGPDFVDRIFVPSDRNPRVLGNLQRLFGTGRLAGTGYLSILPVDQGIEHSGRRQLRQEPRLLRPREHRQARASKGGCNAVASHLRRAGHRGPQVRPQDSLPREDQPQRAAHLSEQVRPDHVRHRRRKPTTWAPPPSARRSISAPSRASRQIVEVAQAFAQAHELGMATVLWCYLRNSAFKKDKDYHVSADLTGQANHLGVTIQADIIKQKLPENNGGFKALNKGGVKLRQVRRANVHRAVQRPPDRPDAATRSPIATWAAPA